MSSFLVSVPREFEFSLCLEFLKRSPHEILHTCEGDQVTKLIAVAGKRVLFRVSQGKGNQLKVKLLNTTSNATIRRDVTQYVREWFDVDTDLIPFYSMAARDQILSRLVKQFYGYRVVGYPDLFESLVWAVLGQQINVPFAYLLKKRFVEQHAERLVVNGQTHYIFPYPAVVSQLTDSNLLPLQFSRQKSRYTIGIAEAFVENRISKEKLRGLPFADAKEMLMRIKGVGNWTASYALMKTFHYPEAFPLEDAGLHNALKKQLRLDRKPTLEEVRKAFRRYKGWEAYATLYLWKSL